MSNLKKGDIVKWRSLTPDGHRGIIVGFRRSLVNNEWFWFRVFSFNSGQIVLKRMDNLIKVEERGHETKSW